MVDISDNLGWVAVVRPETTDLCLGGNETNFPGLYFKQLASRDKFLLDLFGGTSGVAQASFASFKQSGMAAIAQGRLTPVTAVAVPVTDATAITTLYYTPFFGNLISLWNATDSRWDVYTFTERSVSLSGLTANTNHDVFLFDNAGTLTLQVVAWSNNTTRASAISRRDGIWVKTSDNRRYLGTFRTTGTTGQTESSVLKRYVWNVSNQIDSGYEMTNSNASVNVLSHTYTGTTRVWGNSTLVRVELVVGLQQQSSIITVVGQMSAASPAQPTLGYGFNTTTAFTNGVGYLVNGEITLGTVGSLTPANLTAGYHFIQGVEASANAASTFGTIRITGTWLC